MILALSVSSCDMGGNETPSEFVALPVDSVVMPTQFKADSTTVITVKYKRPTDCHIFNGFYYSIEGNTRFVAINAVKLNRNNCQVDNVEVFEVPLNFRPATGGHYVFNFWTGDVDGVEQYLSYDVEVNP